MLKITRFKEVRVGALQAVFNVLLPNLGLEIRDMKLMETANGKWFSFPAKQYTNQEGETKYFSYLYFKDDKIKQNFDKQLEEAINEYLSSNQGNMQPEEIKEDPSEELPF